MIDRIHSPNGARLILALAVSLTAAAWYVSKQAVQESAEQRFEFRAEELETAIHDRMIVYEQVLWGGAGLFNATDEVSREHWHEYVSALDINEHWPGIQGMGFAIPLEPSQLESHVAGVRAEGFPEYNVRPEEPRAEYTSIIYLEPFDDRNQRAFGFDMWSNDLRRQAMRHARDSGVASTSGAITLVQETEEDVQRGFLTYVPVYSTGTVPATSAEREETFEGWVYAAFRMGDLMQGVLGSELDDVSYEIFDGAELGEESLLFDSNTMFSGTDSSGNSAFQKTALVSLQGREWTIAFRAGGDFLRDAESRQPAYIALAGLMIDLLLFLVIAAQRRARSVAESVSTELQATKDDLEAQTIELQKHTEQLERSNGELEQFASAASHDLQEPLRTIGNYSALLSSKYQDKIGEEGNRWLGYISGGAQHLSELLQQLLGYAALDADVGALVPVDLDDTLTAALADLGRAIDEADVEIIRQPLPVVLGNEFQMERLFLNLVGNAIKYRSESGPHRIWIDLTELGDEWRVSVRDNGIGIKPEFHQRVFEIFKRVGSRSKYDGTGIGLAVCQKIVVAHGGSIGVDSTPGSGSEFWFMLPRVRELQAEIDLREDDLVQALTSSGSPS